MKEIYIILFNLCLVLVCSAALASQYNFNFSGGLKPWEKSTNSVTALPGWKQAFMKANGMTEDYFKAHIFVIGTHKGIPGLWPPERKENKYLFIDYYFSVGWAWVMLEDSLIDGQFRITRVKPVEHISSQDKIIEALRKTSLLLGLDVNNTDALHIDSEGQLMLDAYGTVDDAANKCLRATVFLDSALVSVENSACRIY